MLKLKRLSSEPKYAVLIQDLGDLQVFHLLKESERSREKEITPYEVYWQSKKAKIVYGPFVSAYSCFEHWKLTIEETGSLNTSVLPKSGTLIAVDFKNKKRK
jgi:hypothetical protein